MLLSDLILKNILCKQNIRDKILYFIEPKYFESFEDQKVCSAIISFFRQYRKSPSFTILKIYFKEKDKSLSQSQLDAILAKLQLLESPTEEIDENWLVTEAEGWCRTRAIYNALLDSIGIFDKAKKGMVESIPTILQEALRVGFNIPQGHDYFRDSEKAFDYYHNEATKYPTNLGGFNRATGGGLERKKLIIFLGMPNVGKSRLLVDLSANYIRQGLNVIYFTMELDEFTVRKRFDANLLEMPINSFQTVEKDKYEFKINGLKQKSYGKLKIHEFPTGGVTTENFRVLLRDLELKENFKPDIITVDYLNIIRSFKVEIKQGMYLFIKSICEELRELCVETNTIMLSASQLNRNGWDTTDVLQSAVAESAGINATADLMAAIIGTESMIDENQLVIKILKNRLFGIEKATRKFMVGINNDNMTHYDIEGGITADLPQSPNKESTVKKYDFNFDG